MPATPSSTITPLDYYHIIRGQLEHEDNLISNRLSWFIASQSFLFTAYAIIANGVQTGADANPADPRHSLLVIISTVSTATCLLIFLAILGGVFAMGQLRKLHDHFSTQTPGSLLPPVQGYRSTRFLGLAAPILLPPLFLAVWLLLLMRRLF